MTVLDLRKEARAAMPAVPYLPHLTACAEATWLGRMVNEYSSARVFDALADQMHARGFAADHVAKCRAFAAEERHHGVLCGGVVEALGGRAVAPARQEGDLPSHPGAGRVEGVLRNVLSVSCLSETVAVALIGAERMQMPEGPLRELLTRIWADEIGHARFGWKLAAAIVPSLSDRARARVSRYLGVAFAHLERHELAHLRLGPTPPPEGAALGLCDGRDARALFHATVKEVIVPELVELGLDARAAWEERYEATAA